eukprot:TRINITY_DN9725_c0_g1_i1.p1 TRINITY_DN9725_c0_g1~~TRINITY_DN9725_c0_g1_i1.p1  ORF type:complete len:566 (-),score=126.58 TRINITY_DN9725_c0_g1_i1:414-2111(-)
MGKWDRRSHAGNKVSNSPQDHVASTVVERIQRAAEKLGLEGQVVPFGSFANGLNNECSDCDVTFMPKEDVWGEAGLKVLERFADELPSFGFKHIIRIFQASIPLIKAVDESSGKEVDLCIANHLGVYNSRLVSSYCTIDIRVGEVCRAVKHWAKSMELVGSSDGHLNSYGYTLMSLYYLMACSPPVVPNLQDLAGSCAVDAVPVIDRKWGREMTWDCRFWEDLHLLPKSQNNESIESLLKGFFKYYTEIFDWATQAVSIRLALTNKQNQVPKFNLGTPTTPEGWYVEDPFDLRHNLAQNSLKEGRQRILSLMAKAFRALDQGGMHEFNSHCTKNSIHYLLKCRIHSEKVSLEDFMAAVTVKEVQEPFTVHFPSAQGFQGREVADAFLIFRSEEARRLVHTINDTPIGDWQLRFLPCSSWALEYARGMGEYKEVPVEASGLRPPSSAPPPAPAPAVVAAAAAVPSMTDAAASEKVRSGLRSAVNTDEVKQLIEIARKYGLKHEEQMAEKRLKQIEGQQFLAGTGAATIPSSALGAKTQQGSPDIVQNEGEQEQLHPATSGGSVAYQ